MHADLLPDLSHATLMTTMVAQASKAHFEKLVRLEFAKAMAGGVLSANEAAIQAVSLARARAEHLDTSTTGC